MACAASAATSSGTVSRCSSRLGPSYQGIASLRLVTLSPFRPDTGIAIQSLDPDLLREGAIIGDDRVERGLVVIDQVHLVHREHEAADADQLGEIGMPPRLGQHALARIDQEHGEVGGRGAGHHVARILLVARRIGDDELALLAREEAIGDVDRDALLALGREAVDEQREVDLRRPASRAACCRFRARRAGRRRSACVS